MTLEEFNAVPESVMSTPPELPFVACIFRRSDTRELYVNLFDNKLNQIGGTTPEGLVALLKNLRQ